MAEDLPPLYAVDFTESERDRLSAVSFGADRYGKLVTEWLLGSDVLDSMQQRGTKVWLFETEDGQVAGIGSLGRCRRRWPPPHGDHKNLLLIPMLVVAQPFRGDRRPPEARVSTRIFQHILAEAEDLIASRQTDDRSALLPRLLVYVHDANDRALRFWQRIGFRTIPNAQHHDDHLILQLWAEEIT
jgi:GNAT superfamily N-acetyltransferase